MNLNNWFKTWIDEYCNGRLRKPTVDIYESYFRNYIESRLGHLDIAELSAPELQCFYDEIIEAQKISIKTLRNIHSVIHRGLKTAVRLGIIQANPSASIELPREDKSEVEILREDEILKLKDAITDERLGISVFIALYTGLRLGEILGLKWSKVDLSKRTLKVTHSISRQSIGRNNSAKRTQLVLHEPKTESSKRSVPLKGELVNKLIEFKEQQKYRYYKENIEEDFVLSKIYMKPIDPRTIQEFFKRMQLKAGIRNYKFHALRHTFASRAIRAGASDKVISNVLGHGSVTTTSNIYVHINDEMISDLIYKM